MNIRRILWHEGLAPSLEEGEETVREGRVVLIAGIGGSRRGPVVLTTRRVIWWEPVVARFLKPISGQIALRDIASVDKGTLFDVIGGGRPLRLRLKNGKDKCLIISRGNPDDWVSAIRDMLSNQAA